jgi:hypothetical protein
MAKKKIGIYSPLESTANQKVEDLFLILGDHSIAFSVKNIQKNTYVAFEYFENDEQVDGWGPLIAYLQNNSKLIHAIYRQVHFVLNHTRFVVTKKYPSSDSLLYLQEFILLHGPLTEEELQVNELEDGTTVVFTVPDHLATLLTRTFSMGKWRHYSEWVIPALRPASVSLHLFDSNFLLTLHKDNQLKLIKYAKKSTADQNSYTILNACQQIGLMPSQMHLQFIGEPSSNTINESLEQDNWKSLISYFDGHTFHSAPNSGIGASLNKEYTHHSYATYFIF